MPPWHGSQSPAIWLSVLMGSTALGHGEEPRVPEGWGKALGRLLIPFC